MAGWDGPTRRRTTLSTLRRSSPPGSRSRRFGRRSSFADRFDVDPDRTYSDHETLFRTEPLDIVSVRTWHGTHARIAIDACEAGVHVLREKPIATSLGETEDMLDAANRNDVRLVVDTSAGFTRLADFRR